MVAEKPFTINDIKSRWNEVVEAVHQKKPTIASLLLNSEQNSYDLGNLVVTLSESAEGLVSKNVDLIEDALYNIFQIDIDIRFKFTESEKLQAIEKTKGPNKKEIIEELEKVKAQDPLVKNLCDEFDLEPI
jgi:2C-methyl-D-erythritol 2,4-cyclodiphosphate synthase